jgi:hypothetical protein
VSALSPVRVSRQGKPRDEVYGGDSRMTDEHKPKVVPLVVYKRNGKTEERVVIGVATVYEDSGFVECLVTDLEIADGLKVSVNDMSIGWLHPTAGARDIRGGGTLSQVMDTPLNQLSIVFKSPTLEEL